MSSASHKKNIRIIMTQRHATLPPSLDSSRASDSPADRQMVSLAAPIAGKPVRVRCPAKKITVIRFPRAVFTAGNSAQVFAPSSRATHVRLKKPVPLSSRMTPVTSLVSQPSTPLATLLPVLSTPRWNSHTRSDSTQPVASKDDNKLRLRYEEIQQEKPRRAVLSAQTRAGPKFVKLSRPTQQSGHRSVIKVLLPRGFLGSRTRPPSQEESGSQFLPVVKGVATARIAADARNPGRRVVLGTGGLCLLNNSNTKGGKGRPGLNVGPAVLESGGEGLFNVTFGQFRGFPAKVL